MNRFFYLLFLLSICSCEQEVNLTPPNANNKIVVEGVIQAGYPAYVMLTKSEPYFSTINTTSYQDVFITDAVVNIKKHGGEKVDLININNIQTNNPIIDSLIYSIGQQYPGFYVEWPFDILNFNDLPYKDVIGDYGNRYDLEIVWNQDTITSSTTIPYDYTIDSIWFKLDTLTNSRDSLGNFWFRYSDPDTLGNTLMFESKRLAHIKEWIDPEDQSNIIVSKKRDPFFSKALWGFVRNDFEGLNGTSFESFFQRGNISENLSNEYDDIIYEEGERGYFKMGQSIPNHNEFVHPDTVLVRVSQIDIDSYNFWRSYDFQQSSNGNPFAEPLNLQTNIKGGYGIWNGKSSTYFKAIAKEGVVYKIEDRYYPFINEIL